MGDWVRVCAAWLFVSLGGFHNEVVYSALPSFRLAGPPCTVHKWCGLSRLPPSLPIPALSFPLTSCFALITNILPPHPAATHTDVSSHFW